MLKILNDIYADPEKIGAKSLVGWFMTNGGKEPRRRTSNGIVSTSNGDRKPLTSHGMYIRLVEKVDLSASQIEHQW
ncbi:hypothetical protein FOC4_g10009995 [Fusarium odoratissimum]|uniref:Uncharacterized protein n=1 Tax=Fusarium oxysporum f. sp. cubense (strain race 4) TaxID=2502994 RepID=N1S4N8_FUSC4|nr:hypothetical protein FOC4_g10009995 [Fusarium odoratissimum]